MSPDYTDIGSETLRRMNVLDGYNRWIVDEIRSWVGDNVLEVGSGTGNISQFFLDSKQLILTDIRKSYIDSFRVVLPQDFYCGLSFNMLFKLF